MAEPPIPGCRRAELAAAAHGSSPGRPVGCQLVVGESSARLRSPGCRASSARAALRGAAGTAGCADRCYERHGTEPTSNEIEVFARANGIPYPQRERGKPWSEYVSEWKDRRRAQGLPVPGGPPPKAQRPDYSLDVGAGQPGERRGRKAWDDSDEVVDWVAQYLKQLRPGERSSQHRYRDWVRGQAGAPWPRAFEKHGGWVAVRDAAAERVRERTACP